MPTKKAEQPAPRYRVDRTKPLSNARRYEYLMRVGVTIGTGRNKKVLKGKELDAYVDDIVWREAHPGEEPVCVF